MMNFVHFSCTSNSYLILIKLSIYKTARGATPFIPWLDASASPSPAPASPSPSVTEASVSSSVSSPTPDEAESALAEELLDVLEQGGVSAMLESLRHQHQALTVLVAEHEAVSFSPCSSGSILTVYSSGAPRTPGRGQVHKPLRGGGKQHASGLTVFGIFSLFGAVTPSRSWARPW